MFAIVTFARADGMFDEVGMNNRVPISDLKTERGILNRVRRMGGRSVGTAYRVQLYRDRYEAIPYRTLTGRM